MISIKSKELHMAAFVLVVVGALNWGLVGLFGIDLVDGLFGSFSILAKLIYILIGLSGVYLASTHMSDCNVCAKRGKTK